MSGKRRHQALWCLTVAALVPLAGCTRGGGPATAAKTGPKTVPVKVSELKRLPLERTVEVVGTLKGWESVSVGAKQKGRVLKVFKDMGDRVKPGETLALLETVDAELAVLQAEKMLGADLAKLGLTAMPSADFDINRVPTVAKAEVQKERAEINLNRERTLAQRNAGIVQDFKNAENDVKAASVTLESSVLEAKAILASANASLVKLDVARQALKDMTLQAPVPSVGPPGGSGEMMYAVSKRSIAEGQMVREGDAVFEMVIQDPLRLWSNVPERYSADLAVGQDVTLTVASHETETFQGKIARINPTVDAASRTFQVETLVPNPDRRLRPGGFAKASILTRKDPNATVVPRESIYSFAGVTKVFLVEGGKAHEVKVDTGLELEDSRWVEVIPKTGTLPDHAQVVTSGQSQLSEGIAVRILAPQADPAKTTETANAQAALNPPAAPR